MADNDRWLTNGRMGISYGQESLWPCRSGWKSQVATLYQMYAMEARDHRWAVSKTPEAEQISRIAMRMGWKAK